MKSTFSEVALCMFLRSVRTFCRICFWFFRDRFKSSTVKECIRAILKEKLANLQYVPEEMPELTKSLSETIKDRLKEEGYDRYKMVVQVVIGEQRGEGVKTACFVWWLHLAASTIEDALSWIACLHFSDTAVISQSLCFGI
ncbi:dynein light chain Tctex-type protein 2B isoform 2-T2 [Sylvia borin]